MHQKCRELKVRIKHKLLWENKYNKNAKKAAKKNFSVYCLSIITECQSRFSKFLSDVRINFLFIADFLSSSL